MKKELYINENYYGEIGKPVFKDTLGKQLCVGDIVCVCNDNGYTSINIIADNFVMGWMISSSNGNFKDISVYKLINYTQIEKLDKKTIKAIGYFKIEIKKKVRKITMKQLERIVGEPFEIVKENDN